MTAQQRLRHAIDRQLSRLRATVPADREAALLALLRAQNRLSRSPTIEPLPDLVTGRRHSNLGGNRALHLWFDTTSDATPTGPAPGAAVGAWGERFLQACGELAAAELVWLEGETGAMRTVDDGDATFHAWPASKRASARWRERTDVDWWAAWLAARHEPELRPPIVDGRFPEGSESPRADRFRRLAAAHPTTMAYQLGYPADAEIGGCTVQTYRDVLAWLIDAATRERDGGQGPAPRSEPDLVAEIASALALDPAVVGRAVAGFTLDRAGAAFHAAVPGVAAAPLVRVGPNRLVWSVHGLTTEPLFFLGRELKRRDPEGYHNTAHLREAVFRRDLYALFPETRFVTGTDRITLRRDDGAVRTDIDAAIFDRKTGTLGIFELKSHDPFARSAAELTRRRDNVLAANRQIATVLDWLNRRGADDLLGRIDPRAAKAFRVQKVYPFVLGRYFVHFDDGPRPDRRAAWGTWPQILRLLDGRPFPAKDANPLASLFRRLTADALLLRPEIDLPPRPIAIGAARLIVHPSAAAFRARAAVAGHPIAAGEH